MTIITGFGIVLLGACVGFGTRSAGVVWGRRHRCWTALAIRVAFGLVLYGAAGYLTFRGFSTMAEAQSFPRDSQTILTGRAVDTPQRYEDQQRVIAELLAHMHQQEVINSQQIATVAVLEGRVRHIEEIKPDTISLRLEYLESSLTKIIALLVTLVGATLLNLWSSWTKRPKGSEGT